MSSRLAALGRVAGLACALCALLPGAEAATPIERRLDLTVTIDGEQSWRNVLQWSKGSTRQRYDISVNLHSDGRLYPENLLDPDITKRLAVREEFLTRRGLEDLRRRNGGKLPTAAQAAQLYSKGSTTENIACKGDDLCTGPLAERFAALAALEANSIEDLEAFLDEGDHQPNGRYYYFLGDTRCQARFHGTQQSHVEGMQANDRKKEKLVPFVFDRKADSRGTPDELAALCRRYLITLDTQTGDMYLENAFLPSPQGTTVTKHGDVALTKQGPLPIPVQALDWTSEVVRKTKEAGSAKVSLPFTRPLDGNATVLGDFTGTLKIDMSWSFKPPTAR